MPQTTSAAKALRVTARRRVINDRWRRQIREALHAVRDALAQGKRPAALEAYHTAQSTLDRAARRHIIHPNKAARKKSRLLKAIVKLPT